MDFNRKMMILRDALFMVYVLTKDHVTDHFVLNDLVELYSSETGGDLLSDYEKYFNNVSVSVGHGS